MNNYYSATLGRVLKEWHESHNITMYAIAKMLKANRQPLDDLEAGKSSAPENALRYLVWVTKQYPEIWQNYLAALSQANNEEEQLRISEFHKQELINKERTESRRKAKELEAFKAAIREEVRAEIMAEIAKAIEVVRPTDQVSENKNVFENNNGIIIFE